MINFRTCSKTRGPMSIFPLNQDHSTLQ